MAHGYLTSAHCSCLLPWGVVRWDILRSLQTSKEQRINLWSASSLSLMEDWPLWETVLLPWGVYIEHSCPEGPRKIGCRGPERWPPTALFFPLSALGGCFLKMNHQPTNSYFSFLGKLRLRHAIHFQIIVKTQLISRGVVSPTCNPSSQEVEAGGFRVQGQPQLHPDFKTSLGYIRHYFRKNQKQRNKSYYYSNAHLYQYLFFPWNGG